MRMRLQRWAMVGCMLASMNAHAESPFQDFQTPHTIAAPQARAANDTMLTTKPAATQGAALPWQQPAPVQVTPPGVQAQPAAIPFAAPGAKMAPAASPFGKSTASQYQPIPEGPHTATAVPVENVGAVETSEPAPAVPATNEADPVNEDPAAPTELTAPIFVPEKFPPLRKVHLRVLNKVTARAQEVHITPGGVATVGKLTLKANFCQRSAPNSLPDEAALVEISELTADSKEPKPLFSGWMYRSSPSVSALEHPVYDVSLVECIDPKAPEKPPEKPAEPAKKSKKK